jgi:hypothetical protein
MEGSTLSLVKPTIYGLKDKSKIFWIPHRHHGYVLAKFRELKEPKADSETIPVSFLDWNILDEYLLSKSSFSAPSTSYTDSDKQQLDTLELVVRLPFLHKF